MAGNRKLFQLKDGQPTTRELIRKALKAHDDGLTATQITEVSGAKRPTVMDLLNRMPEIWIDRWVEVRGKHTPVYMIKPDDCPRPEAKKWRNRTGRSFPPGVEMQAKVREILLANESGISAQAIADIVGKSRATVAYHLFGMKDVWIDRWERTSSNSKYSGIWVISRDGTVKPNCPPPPKKIKTVMGFRRRRTGL